MLTIKDLSASKELDTEAMATVRGGTGFHPPIAHSLNYLANWTDIDNRIQLNAVEQTNLGTQAVLGNYGLVGQAQDFDNDSYISN